MLHSLATIQITVQNIAFYCRLV